MINAISSPLTAPERVQVSFKEIASGKKSTSFNSPAILEIGRSLLNAAKLAGARNSNIENEISYKQTEASFLQGSQDTISRISELSVKANSGILSSQDKKAIQTEIDQLSSHLQDTMKHASFNGKKILQDSEFSNVVNSLSNLDISTPEGIEQASKASSEAIDTISSRQAGIGANLNILDIQHKANMEEQANLLDAGSRITDTDMAMAMSQLSGDMILSDVSAAMSAQGSQMSADTVSALLS